MMKRLFVIGMLLMTAAAMAQAADAAASKSVAPRASAPSAGTVAFKPVACQLDMVPIETAMLYGQVAEGETAKASDVLSARAMVGLGGQKPRFPMALDFSSADAKDPDLLYVDFSGEGKFSKDSAIKLTKATPPSKDIEYMGELNGTIQAHRGGVTYPLAVQGAVARMGKAYVITLGFAAATQGACDFGGKTHMVRLVDATSNFRFDDAGKVDRKSTGTDIGSDLVLVDTGDGSFKSCVKAWYGQPIFVDGQWYNLTASAEGSASVESADIKSGLIAIAPANCEVTLVRDSKPYLVGAPGPLPAGEYKLMVLKEFTKSDEPAKRGWLLAGITDFLSGKAKSITIDEGKTAELALGSPLTADLTATVNGHDVAFTLSAPKTQGGLAVAYIGAPGTVLPLRKVDAPKVQVEDTAGKVVETISLEYG